MEGDFGALIELLSDKRYEEALVFSQSLSEGEARWFYEGLCLLRTSQYHEAEICLRRIQPANHSMATVIALRLSESLHGQNRLLEAMQLLLPLLHEDPVSDVCREALVQYGNICYIRLK